MGMSASQARLLSITSRMNDIELRSQQISNTKIRLADESEQVANEYTEALNKTKLTYTDYSSGQAQQIDLTPKNLSTFGYKLINRETNEVFKGDVDAATMYEMIESGQFYIGEGGNETTVNQPFKLVRQTELIESGQFHFVDAGNVITTTNNLTGGSLIANVKNGGSVTRLNGGISLAKLSRTYVTNATEVNISGNTQMAITSDTTGLAKAEADYNAKTAKINAKEKKLDQQLKEMDTEHSALSTEYDSVKSLISDNVSKSFQLFS